MMSHAKVAEVAMACSTDKAVRDALDAVLEVNFSEVNQQPESTITQSELSKHLFPMHGRQGFDRLQFHNNAIFHQQVRPEALLEAQLLVTNRDRHLSAHRYSPPGQFVRQHGFIHRLKQA